MKTFVIEHELPPLRAIYHCECDCETEREAIEVFAREKPDYRIRRVYEKGESCELVSENHGYICDIHGITGKEGLKSKAPVGDMGDRYVVVADFDGKEKPIGYTSNPTGGSLMEGAKKWPACTNPRIIDRQPPKRKDEEL